MSAAGSDLAGLIGRGMLVVGLILVAVAVVAVLPRALRVRRRALALGVAVLEARRDSLTALALLEAQRAETDELLVPWRTLLRWARHPLMVATVDWYRRQRRRRRAAGTRRAHR